METFSQANPLLAYRGEVKAFNDQAELDGYILQKAPLRAIFDTLDLRIGEIVGHEMALDGLRNLLERLVAESVAAQLDAPPMPAVPKAAQRSNQYLGPAGVTGAVGVSGPGGHPFGSVLNISSQSGGIDNFALSKEKLMKELELLAKMECMKKEVTPWWRNPLGKINL
jgi:hypothetical protein